MVGAVGKFEEHRQGAFANNLGYKLLDMVLELDPRQDLRHRATSADRVVPRAKRGHRGEVSESGS